MQREPVLKRPAIIVRAFTCTYVVCSTHMPVGRFREDPRELSEREREIHARQYPEGLLVVGTLLGTVARVGLDVGPVSVPSALVGHAIAIVAVVVGGVSGYLLGIAYRERLIRGLETPAERTEDADAATDGPVPSSSATPRAGTGDDGWAANGGRPERDRESTRGE